MKKYFIFVFGFMSMTVDTVCANSLLQAMRFPKTINDVKFSDRMDLLADDYNNYAELSPYQQLILDDVEAQSHSEIDNINASECATTGNACDIETPVQDGSTYEIATNNANNDNNADELISDASNPESGNSVQGTISNSETNNEQPQGTQQSVPDNSPQVATGYCSVRQPEIPRGQKVPLGTPVRFNDLPMSASEKSKRIAASSKKGIFCSPYGCREIFNQRGKYRPHQGIDIGCTADYFGMPIYTPADGVVTQVTYAQRGKSAGNYIRIKHSDGWETQYMHLEKIFVSKG